MDSSARYDARMNLPIIGWFQNARWAWVNGELQKLGQPPRLIDFGCFDARLLPRLAYKPRLYIGLDNDPADVLPQLRARHADGGAIFFKGEAAADFAPVLPQADIAVALEVLYYFEGPKLRDILALLKERAPQGLLATVLNETGPFFLSRHIVKRAGLVGLDDLAKSYSWREIMAQSLGGSASLKRGGRKNFSARQLYDDLRKVFPHVEARGLPFGAPYRFDAFTAFRCW
jgi:hypothetical protein